jgi:hypothetical protein
MSKKKKPSRVKKSLDAVIKDVKAQEWTEPTFDREMIKRTCYVLDRYNGRHPVLRLYANRRRRDPAWEPNDDDIAQIALVLAKQLNEDELATEDSLGNRLRKIEREDLPDSLDEPPSHLVQ